MQRLLALAAVFVFSACADSASSPAGGAPDAAAGGAGGAGGGVGEPDGAVGGAGGMGGAPGPRACPDLDRDGYQVRGQDCRLTTQVDCDDTNNLVRPGQDEKCANRIDDNCDGRVNEGCDQNCADLDNDGHQDAACNADRRNGGDCNDMEASISPSAAERCGNFRDDNCDGRDVPCLPNCMDADLDGFGNGSGCFGADCNDADSAVNPWASETCGDGVDQDCDGSDLPCPADCMDRDKDGFGTGEGCPAEDCNDTDVHTNPGAVDLPGDTIDQDCDGSDAVLPQDCRDADRDGYGEGDGCRGADCDDADPRVNAGRREICGNGRDDDCDDRDDVCVGMGTGECIDADGDGFGQGACPRGNRDCDDRDRDVNPGARETCNGQDDNCNGETDECPRRNQVCDGAACVGEAGAPCRADGECAAQLGLYCNTEVNQCRIRDGETCDDNAQCNPTAECVLLDACDDLAPRCYQAKGGPCDDSCDCNDIFLCHDESRRCVECLDDFHCGGEGDARDTCTGGGFCAELTAIGGPDFDARLQFLRRLVECWQHFAEAREASACDILLVEDELRVDDAPVASFGGDIDAEQSFVCDNLALLGPNGFDEDAIAVASELFGCGLFDILNVWWTQPVRPGTGDLCLYYTPQKSGFGFPNDARAAVVLDRCDLSVID